jgi:hypothetical protein
MVKRNDSFYIEELRKLGLDLDIEKVKDYSRFHWKLGIAIGYIVSSVSMSIGTLGLLAVFLLGILTDPAAFIFLPVFLLFFGIGTCAFTSIRKSQKMLRPYKKVKDPVMHGLEGMKSHK